MKQKVLKGENMRIKKQPATPLDKLFALQKKVKDGEATQAEKEYVEDYERKLLGRAINQ
jgi:hypothetical protein